MVKKPMYIVLALVIGVVLGTSPVLKSQSFDGRVKADLPAGGCYSEFEFETQPAPLQPTVVNFTLVATRASEIDYEIVAVRNRKRLRWLSDDTVFYWMAPIVVGDMFTGRLEFAPLMSGEGHIWLTFNGRGNEYAAKWCFSPDGEFSLFNKDRPREYGCKGGWTTFYVEDSIFIPGRFCELPFDKFSYDITIKPVFHLGDTSTVTFYLTPLADFAGDAVLEVSTYGIAVVRPPAPIEEPIKQGVPIEIEMVVVPKAVRTLPNFFLRIKDVVSRDAIPTGQSFGIDTFFDEDGSLQLVHDGFESGQLMRLRDSLPASFRAFDKTKDRVNIQNIRPRKREQDR